MACVTMQFKLSSYFSGAAREVFRMGMQHWQGTWQLNPKAQQLSGLVIVRSFSKRQCCLIGHSSIQIPGKV
jgi:hypothetical protein